VGLSQVGEMVDGAGVDIAHEPLGVVIVGHCSSFE
jgi:hypothetical protein